LPKSANKTILLQIPCQKPELEPKRFCAVFVHDGDGRAKGLGISAPVQFGIGVYEQYDPAKKGWKRGVSLRKIAT
jgi:hypothetical protein